MKIVTKIIESFWVDYVPDTFLHATLRVTHLVLTKELLLLCPFYR